MTTKKKDNLFIIAIVVLVFVVAYVSYLMFPV